MVHQVLKLLQQKETTIVWCHKNSWMYLTSTYYWWLLLIRFDSKSKTTIRTALVLMLPSPSPVHPLSLHADWLECSAAGDLSANTRGETSPVSDRSSHSHVFGSLLPLATPVTEAGRGKTERRWQFDMITNIITCQQAPVTTTIPLFSLHGRPWVNKHT